MRYFTIFILLIQISCNHQQLKNSGQGSQTRNSCGGICMIAIEHPSPGFYTMEEWRDIKGYEGYYQVSNYGRVRSLDRRVYSPAHNYITKYGKILSPGINTKGYHQIAINRNGVGKRISNVSRYVAEAFLPNAENKSQVNHIDGIKSNNKVENLEWTTCSENRFHAHRIGLIDCKGNNARYRKLNSFQVRVIRKTKGLYQIELAEIFNVTKSTISDIQKRKSWKHIG